MSNEEIINTDSHVPVPAVETNDPVVVADDAEDQEAKTAPLTDDTDAPKDEKDQAEKTFTQKELDEILEKRTAKLARQRDKERQHAQEIEKELRTLKPTYQPTGEPQLEQFENPKDFGKALANWYVEQANLQAVAERKHVEQKTFVERVTDFREDLADVENFNIKKFDALPIPDLMADAILDSDCRVKLAVHLTENPDEAKRIASLSPARQASEIGKLEAKLTAPPAPKKQSQTPAPITPVGGKSSVVTRDLYDPKISTSDYIELYNKRQAELRQQRKR